MAGFQTSLGQETSGTEAVDGVQRDAQQGAAR